MAPIPNNAKKVFDGVIFDVYQWEQEMFDGSTETFEMLARQHGVEVVAVTPDGECILLEEFQPHWPEKILSLVGGGIDEGELPLDAAKRELHEEAALESDDWEEWFSYEPSAKMEWTVTVFIARNVRSLPAQNLDAGEKITVLKKPFDEFTRIVSQPNFRSDGPSRRIAYLRAEERLDELKSKLWK